MCIGFNRHNLFDRNHYGFSVANNLNKFCFIFYVKSRFVKNFAKYEGNEHGKALVSAGPQL